MHSIGYRIRCAREKLNLSQEELGKLCGTTKQTIFKYETGVIKNIPIARLKKIADALHTSVPILLGEDRPLIGQMSAYVANDDRYSFSSKKKLPVDGDTILSPKFTKTFRNRLAQFIECTDLEDLKSALGTCKPYSDILDNLAPITLDRALRIQDECGLPLAYFIGLIDDPSSVTQDDLNMFGNALCNDGSVDLGLLALIFMKQDGIDEEAALKKAEEYTNLFQTFRSNQELEWLFFNASPEIQQDVITMLKNSANNRRTRNDGEP